MIKVGTLAKIRSLYHRDKQSIKEISRQTGLARNTVRSWLREPDVVEPKYAPRVIVTKLDAYVETLNRWLKADSGRGKRERRSKLHMWQELCDMGYTGSYARVCAYARLWKIREGLAGAKAAFIPLKFKHGDASQFDWSTEYTFIGGVHKRVELAHTKLCASRAFWLTAYPSQGHEMLFDAHVKAFAALGGVPQRGIYDNMKTAVDRVLQGKKRKINSRFEAVTGHYLFEPEFCNVASGWEKGIVEKNVRDRRASIWYRAKDKCWTDWAQLNDWLAVQCKQAWSELNHPDYPAMKVADALQDEQTQLMPAPRPFDGYVELLAWVSSTSLIHLERKPGGLRNGAPFETLPTPLRQLQTILLRRSGGDSVMAQVLAAVPVHGLEAVLAAVELALEMDKPSGEHVLNILARLKSYTPDTHPQTLSEAMALQLAACVPLKLAQEPLANVDRYDDLRNSNHSNIQTR